MKKIILFFALGLSVISCSSDDSSDNPVSEPSSFLPVGIGNYWVYDVQSSVMDGRDSLYVANDTVISGKTYSKLKTSAQATGFYPASLANNSVRTSNGKILLTGTPTVNFSADLPLSVEVSDFVIFDENANANDELATISGTTTQQIEGYDVDVDYTLTSIAKETLTSHTVGADTFANVKAVEMHLWVKVTVMLDFGGVDVPYVILPEQEVVVSTQYYVENIGVVHVITDFNYELADNIPVEIPLPQSASEHQEEILVDYSVD